MIKIANEIIKSKMTSFLLPNILGADPLIETKPHYPGEPDDDNFTYKSYT
jgi:hypothetical protein